MTTNNSIAQKNVTNVRLFVLFVLLVLSSNGVFAQAKETATAPIATTEVSVVKENTIEVTTASTVASMDFAIWFMGTQKTSSESSSKSTSFSKKALINSGIKTNSVLIRSILKKVSTQESSVA
ncbi:MULTISPECIES: hypothetical protein [Flavobacterium]|uniref:hypothetical protein n=1 Tax=Flavobacterium TaxID=237 RepID=UPI00391C1AFD